MVPAVSVVIPTFNRRAQLERTLVGLADQAASDGGFEVIVVSDGSTDGTDEWLRSGNTPLPVSACFQTNAGPGAARNRGVAEARGPLVLFLDDDVVPATDLVHTHVLHHDLDDDVVLVGPMRTPDDLELSPWVRWEQEMLYKQYDAMLRGDWTATARQFYTGNASVARRHLDAVGGFDPAFRRAEDVQLAYRLADAGLRFDFAPDAVVLHYAQRSFDSWLANASAYGRNDVIFSRDQGQSWLFDSICEEFHGRHRSVQILARFALRNPRSGRAVGRVAAAAARAACRTGPERAADVALSVAYNLEYYRGMREELGDGQELLRCFDAAVERL